MKFEFLEHNGKKFTFNVDDNNIIATEIRQDRVPTQSVKPGNGSSPTVYTYTKHLVAFGNDAIEYYLDVTKTSTVKHNGKFYPETVVNETAQLTKTHDPINNITREFASDNLGIAHKV